MARYTLDVNYSPATPGYCSIDGDLRNGPLPAIIVPPLKEPAPLNHEIAANQPPYCECAYSGKRPLSWAWFIPGLSSNSLLDRLQLEFSHEHLMFEQSGDNIGFGPQGLFEESVRTLNYRWDRECLDGSLLRRALALIEIPSAYNFLRSNCQDFVERVRSRYAQLLRTS